MDLELLVECTGDQTRLAVVEDGELAELYIERKGHEKLVGNIYKGRAANVLPGMEAAFVDIGMEKNGFLYAGDILVDKTDFGLDSKALEQELKSLSIRKLVKVGQEILVQVIKEPGGSKGPRLTSHITLPGRLAVLLPTVGYVGISRRIEAEEERARLRALAESLKPQGMGLIIRTAAEGAQEAELERDIRYLTKLWASISQRAATTTAPALLHRDVSLVYRAVRDMLVSGVKSLTVDDDAQYALARSTAEMLSPELAQKVRHHEGNTPLFEPYRIDAQAEKALLRRVWLKSGGYLVFDYAEALTVIDVNTGKFVGKHSLSDTVFTINCEAVVEIARQLRLRDIGGIIVIDFIDMDRPEQREQLLALLRKELKKDRTKTNLVGITELGLVEMTRKKVHQPIHTLLTQPCPTCQGSGRVLSDESVARAALGELRSRAALGQSNAYLVETTPAVAGQMLLIGCALPVKAFVVSSDRRRSGDYIISPVSEGELPPKARQIPKV
jgi:ribonuclease G